MSSTDPMMMPEPMAFGTHEQFMSQDMTKKLDGDMTLSVSLPSAAEHKVEHGSPDFVAVAGADDHGHQSPFQIHSSVLDSVFSSVLDEHEQLQDHTPMFDDLDFVVDGAKVNTKDDWVALFGRDELQGHSAEPEPEADLLAGIPKEELADSHIFEKIVQEEAAAADITSRAPKRLFGEIDSGAQKVSQPQLFTPNPSLTLPTPFLDDSKKVDRFGCVTYSKKQRTQPLPPVDTKTSDPVLMKRAKNTEAARRSRARKMERMTQLESKVEELLKDKESLEQEVSRLRAMLKAQGVSL